MKKKLRVGLLLNDYMVPAWAHLTLRRIDESDYADIVLVVLNATIPHDSSLVEKISGRWREIPSALVSSGLNFARTVLMERVAVKNDALAKVDSKPLLDRSEVLTVTPIQKENFDYFADDDIAKVETYQIDVLVSLGFRVLQGGILSASKYGVWSYHHGDVRVNRGGPPGFWETMESWPETGAVLQILTEDLDGGTVLYRSWSCTNKRSVKLNNTSRYWTSASFLPRTLERLYSLGESEFRRRVNEKNLHPVLYCNRPYSNPRNKELFVLLGGKLVEKIRAKIYRTFYFNQWFLLYCFGSGMANSLSRFKHIVPPRDRFWADPCTVYEDDTYYIFLEELIYKEEKGHISVITMDGDGNHSDAMGVIEELHHLSYPFLFTVEGSTYMLAEACEARVVPLYRCEEFPHKWTFERNILEDVTALDPTLLRHGNKWYLFVGMAENPGSSTWDELFLFFADDPINGTWRPHPLNPIVSDVKTARPAGRIIERNGILYRPSQNSSHHYGYGLNLSRILKLNEHEYEEELVCRVEPSWSPDIMSIHTLSNSGDLTVVDGQLRRAKYW